MSNQQHIFKGLSRREVMLGTACSLCAWALGKIPAIDAQAQTRPSVQPPQKGLLKPRQSPWFSQVQGQKLQCQLCPHNCQLASGERSRCRVRENRDGQGYTLTYGNPALVQEEPVERLPFFHVLPGSRTLAVSTAGCNLACKFCEVWDMALVEPEEIYAYDLPPDKVIQHAKASNLSSISYAFGEPVAFYEYLAETAALARENGLLNLLHTAAYIQPEPLQDLIPYLDAANVDLKSFEQHFYQQAVGGQLQPVLQALQLFRDKGVHLEITNIIIPGLNDDQQQIKQMCQWIAAELGPEVPLHLARFYPLYKLSHLPQTPVSTLDKARETALEAGLKFVYVARVTGHPGEHTFCPGCREQVIQRTGFIIDRIELSQGKCQHCQTEIPGKWS